MEKLLVVLSFLVVLNFSFAETAENNESRLTSARSILTSEVVEREPIDNIENFELGKRAWLFTDIRKGTENDFIYHIWYYHGEEKTLEMAKIKLNVGGPRWRTWSNKYLGYLGKWSVDIVDPKGKIIDTKEFNVVNEKPKEMEKNDN